MTLTLPQLNVKFPQAQGFDARIDDLYVRAAPGGGIDLSIYTKDSLAERRDDEGSFYENVLDLGYVWARTQWFGGEGLDWDPPDRTGLQGDLSLDLIRFWDSSFLDISAPGASEPYTLNLTKQFQAWPGTLGGIGPGDMAASSAHLYVAHEDDVKTYESWTNTTPVTTINVGTLILVLAVAPNGSTMLITSDGKIWYRRFDLGAYTMVLDPIAGGRPPAQGVWFTKGRFIVGLSNTDTAELLEVTPAADGLSVTDVVIDTATGTFASVVSSGPALVSACTDGTVRTYTPFLDSNDPAAVGQLIPRSRFELPTGERPILLGDIANILVILSLASSTNNPLGNEVRAYTAEVLDARFDYSIGNVQLKRTWLDTSEVIDTKRTMITTRDELFFTVHEVDDIAYLWRFDAVTTGLSRHRLAAPLITDRTTAMVRFQDVIGGIGNLFIDLFYEDTLYYDEGYIITPNITFGLNTPINWTALVVEARNLGQGATIEVYGSTDPNAITDPDDPSWVLMRRLTSNAQSGIETAIQNITSRTFAMQIKMFPTRDNLISPELTRLAVRGLPQHRDLMVDLPINISDLIEVPGRQPVRIPGWGNVIHEALLDRVGQHVELEIYNPPLVLRGVVDNLLEPTSWISPRGSAGQRCILQFRGNRITEGGSQSSITGNSLTGMGLLGISTTGLGNAGPT